MGADVDLLGYLQDPTSEIETWRAMIVPIRIGGGTRVKIAHAFSRGCPVIATTLGAFGYDAVPGKHLLIADSPVRLANACLSLIQDPAKGAGIASAAWDLFVTRWTWDAIAPAVRGVVEAVLAETRGLPAPVGEAATEAGHVEAR